MACILQGVMILESHVEGVSTIEIVFIGKPFHSSGQILKAHQFQSLVPTPAS
jgi:hypothetical protein